MLLLAGRASPSEVDIVSLLLTEFQRVEALGAGISIDRRGLWRTWHQSALCLPKCFQLNPSTC